MTNGYPEEFKELRKKFIIDVQIQAEAFYKEAEALIDENYPEVRFQFVIEHFCGGIWSRLTQLFDSQRWDYAEFR